MFKGSTVPSAVSLQSGYIYNATMYSGDQLNVEYQVTIPTTSGQESLNISFAPVQKVCFNICTKVLKKCIADIPFTLCLPILGYGFQVHKI